VSAFSDPRMEVGLDLAVRRSGARMGALISESGMLAGQAGDSRSVDMDGFVSLASAQAAAARALAPLVCGREFSELWQEGPGATVRIADVGSEWVLASLHELPPGSDPRPVHRGDHVAILREAMTQRARSGAQAPAPGVGTSWTEEAESRIDRIFRGEG
jgi:hypothetical protein